MFINLTKSLETFIFIYGVIVISSYLLQGLASYLSIKKYLGNKEFSDQNNLLDSQILPKIALIAPAYNESLVITESVRSLLTVHYFDLEIVIVNDGSTDDTLQKLIKDFDLTVHEQRAYHSLKTEKVNNTYRSTKKAFKNLVVIDKVNGRKADAINVGINYSYADYYAVIDLDCILEPHALLEMIEPVLRSESKKVVAVGGVIGATNDSIVRHGRFKKAHVPNNILPRIQVLEYIRAFILGRPAWSSINGLLIISGALGIFERETLIAVEGYSHEAVGEDMDLVMKMHKYCLENKIDYKIGYVPFPLCWTEVPESKEILGSQRNRWMRGTLQCMLKFKKMCLNPKYGIVGMISYPYWVVTEMLAPIIELIGLALIIYLVAIGHLNILFAIMLFIVVYLITLTHSFTALLVYYLSFRKYTDQKDLLSFFKTAILEPIAYHPRVLSWSLRGYYDYFIKKNLSWGNMVRVGFSTEKPKR